MNRIRIHSNNNDDYDCVASPTVNTESESGDKIQSKLKNDDDKTFRMRKIAHILTIASGPRATEAVGGEVEYSEREDTYVQCIQYIISSCFD